ncbi:hypothetical protein GCM10010532_007900 [Dactylosporangium siamense]|uniref:Uncharacterized protein n=1 Tax=Dactylosporangium siamense TaxID=685454 RepID=A0A919PD97_9ACTN|nr:hypothetical protein Dsi01nite_007010 [Dactylosporangium siamense]
MSDSRASLINQVIAGFPQSEKRGKVGGLWHHESRPITRSPERSPGVEYPGKEGVLDNLPDPENDFQVR